MRNKRTIFIELTSLLDVILIMIFVLLSQAKSQTAQAQDRAAAQEEAAQEIARELEGAQETISQMSLEMEELGQEAEELKEEVRGLKRQLDSRELVLENSLLITLSIGDERQIRLEQEEKEREEIPYDWDDDTYARNRLRSLLKEGLKEAGEKAVFLVFQYDRSRIYKTEYDMIAGLLREMKLSARQQEIPCSILEMDIEE